MRIAKRSMTHDVHGSNDDGDNVVKLFDVVEHPDDVEMMIPSSTNTLLPMDIEKEKAIVKPPRCFCYDTWVCCCCVWILGLNWKIKAFVVLLLIVIVVMLVLALDFDSCLFRKVAIEALPDPTTLLPQGGQAPTAQMKKRGFVLTLLGDSLIIDPEWNFGFNNKIKTFLGEYNVTVFNHGRRGERMNNVVVDMRRVFFNYTTNGVGWEWRRPDGVIIMTASDINSEIPWEYNTDEYKQHQAKYLKDFRYVLDTIISHKVPVAVASPGTILKEGPFAAPQSARFVGKPPALEDYCRVVDKLVKEEYNIPYIDIHRTFKKEIPIYRLCYKGEWWWRSGGSCSDADPHPHTHSPPPPHTLVNL